MSPVQTLPLSIGLGIAGAVVVVIFHSVAADVVGGAIAVAALVVVIWSTDDWAPRARPRRRARDRRVSAKGSGCRPAGCTVGVTGF
jgi:hypothetical protein